MSKRTTSIVVLIATLILTACGGTTPAAPAAPTAAPAAPAAAEPTAAPAAAAEPTAAPAASGEAVTINFLTFQDDDTAIALNTVFDAWKKSDPKYANVTINLEQVPFEQLFPKIETAVAAGTVLDLFMADGPDIKHYAYNKAIIPLDKYFTADELKAFLPINVEAGTYKGQFYSPGIMESCSLMFYNKDMTDAAGVKPPENTLEGWTIEDAKPNWEKTVLKDASGNQTQWGLRWGQGTYFGDYEFGIIRRSAGARGTPPIWASPRTASHSRATWTRPRRSSRSRSCARGTPAKPRSRRRSRCATYSSTKARHLWSRPIMRSARSTACTPMAASTTA
jgi:ABC-type glycerol-3-phosphate transport system substrate-binding protein